MSEDLTMQECEFCGGKPAYCMKKYICDNCLVKKAEEEKKSKGKVLVDKAFFERAKNLIVLFGWTRH